MTFEEALRVAWNGNAIAFLGSGFSKGAKNTRGEDFKSSEEFRVSLNNASSGPSDGNLGDAAEAFRSTLGDFALVDELIKEFSAGAVADHHRTIASIPWRRVYTTNYDNVFETSAKASQVRVLPVTLKIDPYAARDDGLQYVHLNGAIEGLAPEDLDTILKLTDTSYVTSSIAQSPWAITFRNDMRLADAVFYFGYSLFDLDIKRIIYESPDLSRKSFFILGENPTALTKQRIHRYGTLIESNVDSVALQFPALKPAAGQPRPDHFESLLEIKPSSTNEALRDQDVFDLYELGSVRRELVHQSIAEGGQYFLERAAVAQVLNLIQAGTCAVALTSSIGNGKTLILEGLAYRAIEKGYRVFITSEPSAKAAIEFERVAKLDEPALLLVDDYPAWQRELRSYGLCRKGNARVVVTARDTTHDVLFEKLESDLGVPSVPEVRIDKLDGNEIEWVVSTLTNYGLWGDLAGRNPLEGV